MKLGLLGSTETHRGTRWAPNWAFAVREAWAGEFELSENHRDAFWPVSRSFLKIKTLWKLQEHPTYLFFALESIPAFLEPSQKLLKPFLDVLKLCKPHSATTLTGGHNECNIDVDVGFSDDPRRQMETVEFRMADNNRDANRNPGKRPAIDDLTEESRRRIDSIVAQVDAEMERRAQMLARERYWGWLPNLLRDWVVGERVPTPRYKGDTSEGPRLPALGMPMERAFAAHVAVTRRELRRHAELADEVRVLREKNDRLERRSDRLEEQNDRLEEQVETLRLQVSQLMSQHGQIVDVMQEHDGRITENRTDITETQAMVQASDAMLNAWAAQPPAEDDGPQFEAEDPEEGDFDEDPDEDPEEDDDDGDAASDISHVSMDSD
ncbi:hypothetical protein E3N88_41931 [Mikania micrantha]|uniref:Uncharacterized protein n=1 Tax=Mikania micrantha TaxID=192012 RepID=A0A5N6LJ69_9ASTR|nr:hypothetical protein E3N88_41931 [Mikania micrantha]